MARLLLAGALLCIAAGSYAQTTAREPVPAAGATDRAAAGKVELAEGDVRFIDRNRRTRQPGIGDSIYEGESIATGVNGEVHLRMEDGGYIAVRPATKMQIVNFRAEGNPGDRSLIGLLEGSFRSVTGWIAKTGPRNAVVRTPTATIGVRGTEHEPLVIPEGSARGEPGTYDRVYAGETEIRTKQGTLSVRPNQAGFAPHRGVQRPRVLERIPEFFRPTRNEARFSGLHQRISQQLDQQRTERRQVLEQRRKLELDRREASKKAKGAREEQRKQLEQQREKKERAEREKQQRGRDGRDEGKKTKSTVQEKSGQSERLDDKKRRGFDEKKQRGVDEKKQRALDQQQLERRQLREEPKRKADERKREREDQRKGDGRDRPKSDR